MHHSGKIQLFHKKIRKFLHTTESYATMTQNRASNAVSVGDKHTATCSGSPPALLNVSPSIREDRLLTGKRLLDAIRATDSPVRLLIGSRFICELTPASALQRVLNCDFEGSGSRTRVKMIRERPTPGKPWERCWRTTGAATLPVWNHQVLYK